MCQTEINRSFTCKAAHEVRESFEYEKEVLTVDLSTFNQYDYTPTKLAKIQHQEFVFVYDTETFDDEEMSHMLYDSFRFLN